MMDNYISQAGRDPLMTVEEEIECGRRVQVMMKLLEKEPSSLTIRDKRAIRLGKRAKERFVKGNMRMVMSVARKYTPLVQHLDYHDLCQEGTLGLMRAIEKFDPARGYKFSTYAYWWIRQAIGRCIGANERAIRLPINVIDGITRVNKMIETETKNGGPRPSYEACIERSGMSEEYFKAAMTAYIGVGSLDVLAPGAKETVGSAILDLIPDPKQQTIDESTFYREHLKRAVDIVETLPEQQRRILIDYYGLTGRPRKSLAEISKKQGVSREAIRQRVNRLTNVLKAKMAKSGFTVAF